jgi:carbon-monoxide dehydrogenase small subunit
MKKDLKLNLNGEYCEVSIEPNTTLIGLLRDKLGFKGTKENCGVGRCGACTVLLDGKAVYACLILAMQVEGKKIQTIEGLGEKDQLHPLQQSFIDHGAFQCGFCTPGMLITAKALLDENPNPSMDEIRKGISGNLCRCTGYTRIIEAILEVANKKRS